MGSPVVLNIYDLSDYNSWLYWCGAGGKSVFSARGNGLLLQVARHMRPFLQ